MRATAAPCTTLEDVDVQCTHCGVKMTAHLGSGTTVRYFRCATCLRWVTSAYTEVFKADAKMRAYPKRPEAPRPAEFDAVKGRLERWLAALEDQDPYKMLGVSPLDSPEVIRDRYRALALANHPDRGGSVEKMQQLNVVYERITQHRERRRLEALGTGEHAQAELAEGK